VSVPSGPSDTFSNSAEKRNCFSDHSELNEAALTVVSMRVPNVRRRPVMPPSTRDSSSENVPSQ
jgi:hypothetical protein